MKKSNTILLLVIQIAAVFVFSNIFALFKPLEVREITAIKDKADITAELYALKYKTDVYRMKDAGYFDDISFEAGTKTATYTIKDDESAIYVVKIPASGNRTLVFKKPVASHVLTVLEKLKKTFSTLSIVLGVFLIFTGFYLIFLFKKEKGFDMKDLPPLQDYLLKLKDSETELKNVVRQQQESVTKQDELNKSIINNINAAVLFVNPSQRIEIFNHAAEVLFSQSFTHAKNNRLSVILNSFPEITRFIEDNRERSATAADKARGTTPAKTKTFMLNNSIESSGNLSAEIEENENIYRVDLIPVEKIGELIIIKDITEERNREKIDLRHKNFAMLGEMTAFLTHEVRNSLGVIYGYTRTIMPGKGEIEKEKLSRKVEKVNKEINFLSAMMESFLNFSRPIKIEKKEKINLTALMEKIAAEQKIDVKLDAGDTVIENDKALISSVFSNLLLNAKEAGADRAAIEVAAHENKLLEILVKDNGRGIESKARDKIWYPFFTTKKKGTGMGLAIIRKIVNSLNGDISLIETGSQGTTFKITFYN